MREAAAADEALLIDFNATEAGKLAGGHGQSFGWVPPGQPIGATGGASWMPPHPGFAPFPHPVHGPIDNAMSPPPPYGYPLPPSYQQQSEKPPAASAPQPQVDEKKQPSFNIPPNNLGADSKPPSKDDSPTNNCKTLNTNLQVCIYYSLPYWTSLYLTILVH